METFLWTVLGVIVGLIILMLLVIAHEFGHFIMARCSGVRVREFGIGFPPRAIAWVKQKESEVSANKQQKSKNKAESTENRMGRKWQKIPKADWNHEQNELIFSLNWLPIGGFCALDGEGDSDTRPGTFGAASFWSKTKVLFGGVIMNWLVAIVILTILALTGMPQFINHQFYLGQDAQIVGNGITIEEVMPNTPAEKAGFKKGDQIVKVNGEEILYPNDISQYDAKHTGKDVKYTIRRNDEEQELTAHLNPEGSEYILGISMSYGQTFVKSTWSAPIVGIGTTIQITGETFRGFGQLVANLCSGLVSQFSGDNAVREAGRSNLSSASESVSGPIGIIGVIFPTFARSGPTNLAFLAALISISLACMNILPIPALDGGRWAMIAFCRLRGKKLKKEIEEKIVSRAFMALLILILVISILDIAKLF